MWRDMPWTHPSRLTRLGGDSLVNTRITSPCNQYRSTAPSRWSGESKERQDQEKMRLILFPGPDPSCLADIATEQNCLTTIPIYHTFQLCRSCSFRQISTTLTGWSIIELWRFTIQTHDYDSKSHFSMNRESLIQFPIESIHFFTQPSIRDCVFFCNFESNFC